MIFEFFLEKADTNMEEATDNEEVTEEDSYIQEVINYDIAEAKKIIINISDTLIERFKDIETDKAQQFILDVILLKSSLLELCTQLGDIIAVLNYSEVQNNTVAYLVRGLNIYYCASEINTALAKFDQYKSIEKLINLIRCFIQQSLDIYQNILETASSLANIEEELKQELENEDSICSFS